MRSAARDAGCRVVFCAWGYDRRDDVEPDAEAATVGELAKLLLGASCGTS